MLRPAARPAHHWLVKQEPSDFSWDDFVREGGTAWTGVRNALARIHLRAMKTGDEVLFYHSGEAKCIVGVARVARGAYPDPTDKTGTWVAIDLTPDKPFPLPVPLASIKQDPAFQGLGLVRQSRLSVMPVNAAEWRRLLKLGGL